MAKKRIGVRLDQEVIDKLSEKGKPSKVIRDIVMDSLKPKPPPQTIVKEVVKEVIKEIPIIKYVNHGSFDWTAFNKRTSKTSIISDMIDMPQWFIKYCIKRHGEIYGDIDGEILESYKKHYLEDYEEGVLR